MKANGLPCCIRTTPIPLPKASLLISNGFSKHGMAKTGVKHMAFLGLGKASSTIGDHSKAFFLRRVVKGVVILP